MSKQPSFQHRGGVWVVSQIILLTLIVVAGVLWSGNWVFSSWFTVMVLVLLLIGLFFLVSGLLYLGKFLTIFPEPLLHTELVQNGVYGLVRHPLYTSVVFCSLAWSLWWNSLPALGIWGVTVIFLDAKARYEEVRLRQRFSEYSKYAAKVKRLIPWLY